MSDDVARDTTTSTAQRELEAECRACKERANRPSLDRESHVAFVDTAGIHDSLPGGYYRMDSMRAWTLYWTAHSFKLLDQPLTPKIKAKYVQTLKKLRLDSGGYGGGIGQSLHTASTYAAVLCLCEIGTVQAFESIDREKLFRALMSLRLKDGSFRTEPDGEADVRGTYTVCAVCHLIDKKIPNQAKTVEWLLSCQSYEGGFGGEPGNEAHGGYTFCAVAALKLLGSLDALSPHNRRKLERWVALRQHFPEGGYQGRTNKLVDVCYSFWQGATPFLLERTHLINRSELDEFILSCCQHGSGGIRDKPGVGPDFYHTCYGLSGLFLHRLDCRLNLLPENVAAMREFFGGCAATNTAVFESSMWLELTTYNKPR